MLSCTIDTAVPVHQFYRFLINQIIQEANTRTGKEYTEEDLAKGLKYRYYNTKAKKDTVIHVRPPVEDKQLASTWTRDGHSVRLTWSLTPIDENHTEVTHIQENLFKSEITEKQQKKFNRSVTDEIISIEKEIKKQMKKEAKAARRKK
jgi:hypothetical protein